MNKQVVISIVPRLSPSIDGVGDYALTLARQLRSDFGIETHFLIGDPTWTGESQIENFHVTKLRTHSAKTLLTQLAQIHSSSLILLHYVGYGYAKRGCPSWLVKGLKQWKRECKNIRLVTMFHEIYASGYPFWTSAFWTSGIQWNLSKELANLSDRLITSEEQYLALLQQMLLPSHQIWSRNKVSAYFQNIHSPSIPVLPVFSSVGEPKIVKPLIDRTPRLVLFGGRSTRLRAYANCQNALIKICDHFNLKEIIDVGPITGLSLSNINNIPIIELGEQPISEISNLLATSLAGFIDYTVDRLAKSTIFASYCAHGILPIVADSQSSSRKKLHREKHWASNSQVLVLDSAQAQIIADNAYAWYQTHQLSVQAQIFAEQLINS